MLLVNNFLAHSISVLKNSNRVLSSTSDNLAGIRPGSYLKIDNADFLYPVVSSKKICYSKDFETIDSRKLKIPQNTVINIQKDDVIKIIYDEYEYDCLLSILNHGKFYKVGDILTVRGGELSVDISNGIGNPTSLQVDEVEEGGNIKSLSIKSPGKYIKFPQGKLEVYGGSGENCILEIKYKLIDNRNIEERIVKNIEFKDNETFLNVDYSIPLGVEKGQISLEKTEIILQLNYLGETKLNCEYKLFKDFTPYLALPLTVKNNPEFHIVFNEALQKLDAKINELDKKLFLLENRVK